MRFKINRHQSIYLRNFIFGVEDSLVSTVGLLSGIAVAGIERRTLVLTGIILIFVEAFSMAVGSFLSEDMVEESEKLKNATETSLIGALVMFTSYFVAGFIPLLPYMIQYSERSIYGSVVASLIALLGLGIVSARLFRVPLWRGSARMVVLGGSAIVIGILVGQLMVY